MKLKTYLKYVLFFALQMQMAHMKPHNEGGKYAESILNYPQISGNDEELTPRPKERRNPRHFLEIPPFVYNPSVNYLLIQKTGRKDDELILDGREFLYPYVHTAMNVPLASKSLFPFINLRTRFTDPNPRPTVTTVPVRQNNHLPTTPNINFNLKFSPFNTMNKNIMQNQVSDASIGMYF